MALCTNPVSIAEAILWGEQRSGVTILSCVMAVSIAEAILWGEQLVSNSTPS